MKTIHGILNSPRFWLFATIVWAVVLYTLSSFNKTLPEGGPEIPFFDKILHFGYFFGGGIMLTTHFLLKKGTNASYFWRVRLPLIIFALIGALDEYHQTFTPGRSGNDPYDWLADVLGAAAGILFANRFHSFVTRSSAKECPIF